MEVNVRFDVKALEARLSYLQRQVVPLAASSAINKTTAKALTLARREIIAEVGLPQNVFKTRFQTVKASPRRMTGKLWVGLKYGKSLGKLTPAQANKQLKKYGVLSSPFAAKMKSGRTSMFVRVTRNKSGNTIKRSKGRSKTSTANLPIIDIERETVRLSDRKTREVLTRLKNNFVHQEFSTLFHREVAQRIKRKGL